MQRIVIEIKAEEVRQVCSDHASQYLSYGRRNYHASARLSETGECTVEFIEKTPEEIRIAEANKAGQ